MRQQAAPSPWGEGGVRERDNSTTIWLSSLNHQLHFRSPTSLFKRNYPETAENNRKHGLFPTVLLGCSPLTAYGSRFIDCQRSRAQKGTRLKLHGASSCPPSPTDRILSQILCLSNHHRPIHAMPLFIPDLFARFCRLAHLFGEFGTSDNFTTVPSIRTTTYKGDTNPSLAPSG
jgi:hypothetical protein